MLSGVLYYGAFSSAKHNNRPKQFSSLGDQEEQASTIGEGIGKELKFIKGSFSDAKAKGKNRMASDRKIAFSLQQVSRHAARKMPGPLLVFPFDANH